MNLIHLGSFLLGGLVMLLACALSLSAILAQWTGPERPTGRRRSRRDRWDAWRMTRAARRACR